MNLADATRIASMTAEDLECALTKSGYLGSNILEIQSVDIRQDDVRFRVKFEDDGSFEENEQGEVDTTGNIFVNIAGQAEF